MFAKLLANTYLFELQNEKGRAASFILQRPFWMSPYEVYLDARKLLNESSIKANVTTFYKVK